MYATTEDVNRLAAVIKDDWTLCELFDGLPRAKEAEYMVAETIRAARINAEKHGKPFSFVGAGVQAVHGSGLLDNRTAFGWLVDDGFFALDKHEGREVIFPTKKLIKCLDAFFARQGKVAAQAQG